MSDRMCSKCMQMNPAPIHDYCSVCGERASPAQHEARGPGSGHRKTMEFSDSRQQKVTEVSLSSSSGKRADEETKELLAFVRAHVDDAPASPSEFADGIVLCKLIIALAPQFTPRYNPRPKMLQKLNNVHLAVTTMESMGISTAGINSKDVADGNEKQIMNIVRGLFLYSKRAGAGAPSRRLSFNARDAQQVLPVAPAGLAASVTASSTSSPPVMSASVSPTPTKAAAVATSSVPSKAPADDVMKGLAQLDVERREQEQQLEAIQAQIAAMDAQLETLVVPAIPIVAKQPTTRQPTALPPPPPVVSVSPPVPSGTGRVVVLAQPMPPRTARADSSTEGEDDSEEKDAAAAAQNAKKDEAAEKLRLWKLEEDEKKRRAAEEKAAAEIRSVAAAQAAPPPVELEVTVLKKKGRRRKKKGVKKGSSSKASSGSVGSVGGAGGAGSDDEDSGISDSPDGSEEDGRQTPHSPALSAAMLHQKAISVSATVGGGSSSSMPSPPVAHTNGGASGSSSPFGTPPPIPAKTDVVRERGNTKKKALGLRKRTASRTERINSAETDLDAVVSDSAAVKDMLAQSSNDALAALDAGAAGAGTKWHVSQARQDELKSKLGGSKVFLKGLARVQALYRGKAARKKRKLLQKRVYIAREVVESERSYVRNLGLCIDHFYKPMSELSYISDIQLRQMFSEISVIRGFNAHLCGQLEQRHAKWQACGQRLGDIFLSFVAYFRSYTAYVNNYNDAMSLFYQLQAKNKSFQAFLAEKKVDVNLNGQELPAFLIMPIQRLPRYVMLLEDLLRNTPKDHADFTDLSTALAKVQEVADYVNEKKREAENINQVIDVQSRLTGMSKNLAEPHRRFVRQGAVLNNDGKGETMLFLFNDILVTGKESSGLGKLAEKGKEMLGFKKGPSTPKMNRKAAMSPFFGKKKPQLQAEADDREYKYQKTLSLSDCKVSGQFNVPLPAEIAGPGNAGAIGGNLTLKTPMDTLNFSTLTEEELESWLHDLDSTAMRLVERKRLRCERTAKHHEGTESLLVTVGGRSVVNKSEASFAGRVNLSNPEKGGFENKYVCLIKPHLYVFNDAEDDKPQGWLYLLTSHVVLGTSSDFPQGYSFRLHVPHSTDKPAASPWMVKHATRVKGHAGNPNSSVALDKEVVSEEDQDRDVYEFVGGTVNEALNWCREIRNVVLDAVKLPDDLCPLDLLQKNSTEENNVCADCNGGPTRFASINLGVFICEACMEVHEEFLEGISVIRDIKEPWDISPQQRFELEALMGNAKRNKIFEKNAVRKDVPKPRPNDSKEVRARWIKAKYVVSGLNPSEAALGGGGGGGGSASNTPSVRRMSQVGGGPLNNK